MGNHLSVHDELKLNLGCGPVQPEGWVNIDGSNRARLASNFSWIDTLLVKFGLLPPTEFCAKTKYANLLRGIPYATNSVAYIYSGELWEHLEYEDAMKLTIECHRVLTHGGVLRLCVPDGPTFWSRYLDLYKECLSQSHSERNTKPIRDHIQLYFNDICTRKSLLRSIGHAHKWQYDEVQLLEMLELGGFKNVRRGKYHQSMIPDIEKVERSDFLIVEGVKQ